MSFDSCTHPPKRASSTILNHGIELHLMRKHPVLAYRIIHNELGYPEEVALVALQHHERWDGRGYPKSLVGDEISPFARIVSVADAFQAMVSDRPYRSPLTGYTAMRSILSENGKRFDPEILKAFIRTVGIYPLGSLVVLDNGAVGVVVAHQPPGTCQTSTPTS